MTVSLGSPEPKLSELVDKAAAGEKVIIEKAGRPVAQLVHLSEPHVSEPLRAPRVLGALKGKIRIAAWTPGAAANRRPCRSGSAEHRIRLGNLHQDCSGQTGLARAPGENPSGGYGSEPNPLAGDHHGSRAGSSVSSVASSRPFDRMLVAQAQVEGLTIVTADATLSGYDV